MAQGTMSKHLPLIMFTAVFLVCFAMPAQAMRITFAHPAPTSDPAHQAIEWFAEAIHERSDGEITVTIYPNGQLGEQREFIQSMQSGGINMAFVAATHLTNFSQDFAVLDLPFLVTDQADVPGLLEGPVGEALFEQLEEINLVGVGFSEASFRGVMMRRPLDANHSLAGQTMRVPNSDAYIQLFRSLDARPTPLAFGELYSALQQGVVDGAETLVSAYVTYDFHEVAPHFYFSNHTLGAGIFLASPAFVDGLSDEHRQLVLETGREAAFRHREIEAETAAALMPEAEAAGATFSEFTLPDGIDEKLEELYAGFIAEFSPPVQDAITEFLER
ncbi:tripartite ATP-independent transporter DctP family solute receptor [Natronocella acetinitrilica]|uniref:Tripartite ATP-independent transporter DctP family solute receptor n=1 Tax=Natronocella acetinitrilica TaxID=414046 RepID=A0AAE3G401_9GAMM|nr:TRAP transporter substrate-binding protein [Natronocella acetinitrilica]MCP1674987.1 tripartite ATP-independent transporter DctP family solute receptor [Natronocella acetinitrilica]